MTYEEVVDYLLDIPKFTKEKSSDNTAKILEKLNNPQDSFKVIHVAGTNGKGSTCAFAERILRTMGIRTGLFTSPHLLKVNERISICGENIDDANLVSIFLKVQAAISEIVKQGGIHPSFFEYMFILAVTAFAKNEVEVAILEVGMGGRLDATNIVKSALVSVITSISMDHMEILGDTIEKIAGEKAGIIKPEIPVVYYGENNEVSAVIEGVASKLKCDICKITKKSVNIIRKNHKSIDFSISNMYDKYGMLTIPFVMEYQAINATLAVNAIIRSGYNPTSEQILKGLASTTWSGRMEEVTDGIYIDGAHNYEGIEEFVSFVNSVATNHTVKILFSVVKEKEFLEMIHLIASIQNCKEFYVAPISNARALAASDMEACLNSYVKNVPVKKFASIEDAVVYATGHKVDNEVLFCTGSLYMVGEVKKALSKL
ncbi:MAG: bifunctional folylpolyglutamate synthase/dihydrofolate synthase [Clostridiales bacterium]|nr:bifunctional folylpolyglutamate synthase/dihydrofolate synthase [Clostridiales bacterium]